MSAATHSPSSWGSGTFRSARMSLPRTLQRPPAAFVLSRGLRLLRLGDRGVEGIAIQDRPDGGIAGDQLPPGGGHDLGPSVQLRFAQPGISAIRSIAKIVAHFS